jgi:hypothetical protein
MDVAHVVIRIGETTIEDACVRAGERFWIGSRAGAQLAVAGIGAFPLVTGEGTEFTVRAPIGTTLAVDGRAIDANELRLTSGSVVTLGFGLAAIEIELAPLPHMPVPRPPPEARPAAYTAISLLAHLALWGAAIELAPDEVYITARPRLVSIGLRHSFDRDARTTAPARDAKVVDVTTALDVAAPSTPRPVEPLAVADVHARPKTSERDEPLATITTVDDVSTALDHIDIAGAFDHVGPLYLPDEAPGFGKTRQFDPTHRADYQSIASGRFPTISRGSGAGDAYDIARDVELCAQPGCQASGGITVEQMRAAVEPELNRLSQCDPARHGEVLVDLIIGATGKVSEIHANGLGDVATCASNIIAAVEFPAADAVTYASFPLGY